MILTCPACATQYRLKDDAIPPEGRQVRCAACKHKWHQDGTDVSEAAIGDAGTDDRTAMDNARDSLGIAPPPPGPGDVEAPLAAVPEAMARDEAIAQEPTPAIERAVEAGAPAGAPADDVQPAFAAPAAAEYQAEPASEPVDAYAPESYHEDEHGFAAIPAMHDEDEPRRGGKLGWIVGLILFVVVAAAAFWFLAPPALKARIGIAEAGQSQLQLMLTTSDRQKLASGNELLAISGRVINSTDREQAVPPIHAELRDPANNKVVYQWTIPAPARSLAPGAAASFNSAEVDVPQGGESLSLRFAS